MLKLLLAVAVALLTLSSAVAEPQLPEVATRAKAYREKLQNARKAASVAAALVGIRKAQNDGQLGLTVQLYEKLVGLDPDNYRAWLKLGLSWRGSDPKADEGADAAWNAYKLARSTPDQVEALLLLTSIMRSELADARATYQNADQILTAGSARILPLAGCDEAASPGADSTSSLSLTCATHQRYRDEMLASAKQVAQIAHDLDAVYAEIAAKLPGLSVAAMQAGDHRELDFKPVNVSAEPTEEAQTASITYTLQGELWRGCVEFTQELNSDASVYKNFVVMNEPPPEPAADATEESAPDSAPDQVETGGQKQGQVEEPVGPPFDPALSTRGRALCVENLPPGKQYLLKFKKGMRSKLGIELGADYKKIDIRGADILATVQFEGGRFVLPRKGPGLLPVRTINVAMFDVELFRITDRTLYREIALGHLGNSTTDLPDDVYQSLQDHFGQTLWRGQATPVGEQFADKANVNKSVKSTLPIRELLELRKIWLKERLTAKPEEPTFSSGYRPLVPGGGSGLKLAGEFFGDSAEFDSAAATTFDPGVYALVTPSLCAESVECGHNVQWFVETDIGITFYEGLDKFNVVLRSLETGKPVEGRVQLVSAGNRVLGEASTDKNGVATFARSLTRGVLSNALTAVMARTDDGKGGGDFAFLAYTAERLDLSKLNVDGAAVPQTYDAFLMTDRGLYAPGETVHVTALLRNEKGMAIENPRPTMLRLQARDHVIAQSLVKPESWSMGGVMLNIDVPKEARAGPVRVTLSVGENEGEVAGETLIQLGPVKPDQIDIQWSKDEAVWSASVHAGKLQVKGWLLARYLYIPDSAPGGKASGLRVETVVRLSAGDTPMKGCYADFAFGKYDDKPIASVSPVAVAYTDEEGRAQIVAQEMDVGETSRPLAATADITVYDFVGPVGSRSVTVPVSGDKVWLGVAKIATVRAGEKAGSEGFDLDIVRLTAENKPDAARPLDVRLLREIDDYSFETQSGQVQPRRMSRPEPTSWKTTVTGVGARVESGGSAACVSRERWQGLFADVQMGRYVLEVADAQSGTVTTTRIQIGATQTDPDLLEPNIFVLSSGKDVYAPGDEIQLGGQTPFDGPVLVGFARGDMEYWVPGDAKDNVFTVKFKPPEDWTGKGFYAIATVFHALGAAAESFGPGRALGAKYIEISGRPAGYEAAVAVVKPNRISTLQPGDPLQFRVCVSAKSKPDCAQTGATAADVPAEDLYAAAYVVDEGLVNLTGHLSPPPDPAAHFFGRRRLGVRMMDGYARLLTPGGDRPGRLALTNYTSDTIVSIPLGPKKLEGGMTEFTIDNPGLTNGTLAIFVVVWSKSAVATATDYVVANSPVITDLDAPSYLHVGDSATIPLRLINLNMPEGNFILRARVDENLARVSFPVDLQDKLGPARTELRAQVKLPGTFAAYLTVTPNSEATGKTIKLTLEVEQEGSQNPLPGRLRTWRIEVRPSELPSVTTVSFPLTDKSKSLDTALGDYIRSRYAEPDKVLVTVSFANGAEALLKAAQASGRAPPGRTLDQLAATALAFFFDRERAGKPEERPNGERLLSDLMSLQSRNGAFLPYRVRGELSAAEGYDDATPAVATAALRRAALVLNVLALAKSEGYAIPANNLNPAIEYARTKLLTQDLDRCGVEALLVNWSLVQLDTLNAGDLTKIAVCKGDDIAAESLTYAILQRFGLSDQARIHLAYINGDEIGKGLGELSQSEAGQIKLAMSLNVLAESGADRNIREKVAEALLPSLDHPHSPLSPMAAAWLPQPDHAAAASPLRQNDIKVDGGLAGLHAEADGLWQTGSIPFGSLKSGSTLAVAPGKSARAFVTLEGALKTAKTEDALPRGALQRHVYSIKDGRELNLAKDPIRIGDRLVVTLEGDRDALAGALPGGDDAAARTQDPLIVADLLPSAMSAYATDAEAFKTTDWVKKAGEVGDLRSATIEPDRWVGVVLPLSRIPPKEEEPPPAETEPPAPAPAPKKSSGPDFRVAYAVRVNLAGHFVWPGAIFETSSQFASTRHADAIQIDVLPEEPPGK